ncbi:Cell shape-determining protein MreB [Streptomyces antimycoticus]
MTISLEALRRCSIAVDLGAARTRVYLRRTGLIVDEPTVAAVNTHTGGLIAVGALAERMTGRTPEHIRVVRPVSGGTVVDIDMAQRMLRLLLGNKLRRAWRRRPLVSAAVCVQHDADPLAQRAAVETLTGIGAKRVELVDTPDRRRGGLRSAGGTARGDDDRGVRRGHHPGRGPVAGLDRGRRAGAGGRGRTWTTRSSSICATSTR